MLRNEATETGGDGGGAVAAAPEAAAPTTTSTPDVFGGEVTTTSAEPAQPADSGGPIWNQVYTAEGGLADNYTEVLKQAGLENLSNTVGKYKSPDGLLKGAANLISFAGKKMEGTIVPNEGSSEDEIAQYREAIGVPDSPTAYDNLQPENMPEGLEWSNEVGEFWQGKFHEIGLPQKQAEEIAQAYSDFTGIQLEQAQQTLAAQDSQRMSELQEQVRKEWGAEYDANMKRAVDVSSVLGFDIENNADDMAAVRNPKVLNMLLERWSSMQEGQLPRGAESMTSGKGAAELAGEIYTKHGGHIEFAPPEERARYVELQKLAARQAR